MSFGNRALAIAALLLMAIATCPAGAQERGEQCDAVAAGVMSSSVKFRTTRSLDSSFLRRHVIWMPAQVESQSKVELRLRYSYLLNRVNALTDVEVHFEAAHAYLQRGVFAELEVAGRSWRARLEPWLSRGTPFADNEVLPAGVSLARALDPEDSGGLYIAGPHPDLIPALSAATSVVVLIDDGEGHVLARQRFDVSLTERDALLSRAFQTAPTCVPITMLGAKPPLSPKH